MRVTQCIFTVAQLHRTVVLDLRKKNVSWDNVVVNLRRFNLLHRLFNSQTRHECFSLRSFPVYLRSLAFLCGPLRSLVGPCGPLQSIVVPCSPLRSLVVPCGPLQSMLFLAVHCAPSWSLAVPLRSLVVHCKPSRFSFGPSLHISVDCGLSWSLAVLCSPLLSLAVPRGSPAVHCGSFAVHRGALQSTAIPLRYLVVHSCPFRSIVFSCDFLAILPCGLLRSIAVHCNHLRCFASVAVHCCPLLSFAVPWDCGPLLSFAVPYGPSRSLVILVVLYGPLLSFVITYCPLRSIVVLCSPLRTLRLLVVLVVLCSHFLSIAVFLRSFAALNAVLCGPFWSSRFFRGPLRSFAAFSTTGCVLCSLGKCTRCNLV